MADMATARMLNRQLDRLLLTGHLYATPLIIRSARE